jgi:virulence-associated protein VagC
MSDDVLVEPCAPDVVKAQVIEQDGQQVLLLPSGFELPEGWVTVTRHGDGLLIEPSDFDPTRWLAELGTVSEDFTAGEDDEPLVPKSRVIFE